jgi:predicted Zn-dependent peptidase
MPDAKIDRNKGPVVEPNAPLTWDWPVHWDASGDHPGISGPENQPGVIIPKVVYLDGGNEPLLRIDLQWNHGFWHEHNFLTARTMTRMLSEGTVQRSAAAWTGAVDYWGGQIRFSSEAEQTTATLLVLDRFLPHVWPLLVEALTEPAFGQEELNSVLQSKIQHWHIESHKVSFLSARKLRQLVYPAGHPEARLSTPADYEGIRREHLIEAHRELMNSRTLSVSVCGPGASAVIPGLLEDLGRAFPNSNVTADSAYHQGQLEIPVPAPTVVFVPKADALQVSLRVALVWPPKTDPVYHYLKILVTVLGGYFGSRLMQNLREDLGLTYGVGASLRSFRNHSLMTVHSELLAGSEPVALEQIRFEMERLSREQLNSAEWGRVRSYLLGQLMAGLDGPFALMDRYWDLESYGLGEDNLRKYLRTLDESSPSDLMQVAAEYLHADRLVVASAGPSA